MFKYVVHLIDVVMAMFGPREQSIQEVSETIKESKPRKPRRPSRTKLEGMVKSELIEVAAERGVILTKRTKKADMVEAILNS